MSGRRSLRALGVAALVAALGACSSAPVRLRPQISDGAAVGEGRPVFAQACGMQLFLLIPLGVGSRLARGYRALLEAAPGEQIRQISIRERWTYAFVGTVYCSQFSAYAYPLE